MATRTTQLALLSEPMPAAGEINLYQVPEGFVVLIKTISVVWLGGPIDGTSLGIYLYTDPFHIAGALLYNNVDIPVGEVVHLEYERLVAVEDNELTIAGGRSGDFISYAVGGVVLPA